MIIKLTVYLHQTKKQKVGILAIKDKKIFFEYDKEFLKSKIELSPYKLPLQAGLFECNDDTFNDIWGVFADSLPDGWGHLLIDRHFLNKEINPNILSSLDRLAYVGNNGMGALSYEPTQYLEDENSIINLDDIFISTQNIIDKKSEKEIDELLILSGSSGGARPKVLVQINDNKTKIIHNNQYLEDGYSYWMIKFSSSIDDKEAGKVEYAYSLMAKEAGVVMSDTYLFNGVKNSYFATKRFDRIKDKKFHIHTLAGLVHSDFRYPSLDYDDILAITFHLTKNMQEVKKVFRLAVFNLLSHNRDDHAKNFSFLQKDDGSWIFAPAYDLTFSYGVGDEHSTMYMGNGKNPTIIELKKLAKKHNIKNEISIIDEVQKAIFQWDRFCKIASVSANRQNQIKKNLKVIM